ncbi:MAG: helix-turn-helix transcriptional regulator [Holosporaceae bacterium]|jgi:DNA-binding CsgD family transcriptional regulator|nr:helix-turn-helix transcriptional regulator [Holosporaceae bacterium]
METSISEVEFTNREIDVIACIMNGRSTKSSASLLNISPYTVSVHIRNISNKIGCSSQEGIVTFIEKSGKYSDIRNHYVRLMHGDNAKTTLKTQSDGGLRSLHFSIEIAVFGDCCNPVSSTFLTRKK